MEHPILPLRDMPALAEQAAGWFSRCWGIPEAEYRESIARCLRRLSPVPQWYVIADGGRLIAGAGVIENDFHVRRDLSPNVCALYVEPRRRGLGLAGALLEHVRRDMAALGVGTLYLITDHVGFYERYGWEFVTTAECTDGSAPARLYVSPRE